MSGSFRRAPTGSSRRSTRSSPTTSTAASSSAGRGTPSAATGRRVATAPRWFTQAQRLSNPRCGYEKENRGQRNREKTDLGRDARGDRRPGDRDGTPPLGV